MARIAHKMPSLSTSLSRFIYKIRHWETWHWLIKYIPMIPFWIWHCVKARSLWFFTASNPTLTFGGYEGESKMEMYNLLPPGSYPATILIRTSNTREEIRHAASSNGLSFPLAAKPDVGRMGFMFRRINSMSELLHYHENITVDYVLQEFVNYPIEVSIFYYRFPYEQRGNITGFVKKEHLSVTGDGSSTLLELMLSYPRVQFRLEEMKLRHRATLHDIIPLGQPYILCQALNLSRGGKLISLEAEKDDMLLSTIDKLSQAGNFFFGRYDIKCQSIELLKKGKDFSILEFNGSGAEPHHVYGNGNSLIQAIRILLHHWNVLYRISCQNHAKGVPYWSFTQGVKHMLQVRKHVKLLRSLEFRSTNDTKKIAECKINDKADILQRYQLTVNKSVQT